MQISRKLCPIIILACLAQATGATDLTEHDGSVRSITFRSAALHTNKTFCAVLPEGFAASAGPWPVLFLFHGRGRTERSLIDDPGARKALLAAPFVTVLPDGNDGWYINSPAQPEARYQDYIDELITVATDRLNLSTDPRRRALSGWSMGGYGCTRYAIDRPGQFAVVAPIIGLLDFPRTGLPEGQSYEVPEERFTADPETWAALNPIHQAETLRGSALCIITGTTAFDRTMNLNFARRLAELEIPHTLHILEGGHTFDLVRASLPIVVDFITRTFAD
ncbi:MAG: hypothetical protein KF886_20260 [Candidatus Hydrogenedentes bacterium]|nr:hypothetical protein [Candidatus Hydrogenedentota bacterium]